MLLRAFPADGGSVVDSSPRPRRRLGKTRISGAISPPIGLAGCVSPDGVFFGGRRSCLLPRALRSSPLGSRTVVHSPRCSSAKLPDSGAISPPIGWVGCVSPDGDQCSCDGRHLPVAYERLAAFFRRVPVHYRCSLQPVVLLVLHVLHVLH